MNQHTDVTYSDGQTGTAWEPLLISPFAERWEMENEIFHQAMVSRVCGAHSWERGMDLKPDSNVELIIITRISEMDLFNFAHL
jgi:hypothetical protein